MPAASLPMVRQLRVCWSALFDFGLSGFFQLSRAVVCRVPSLSPIMTLAEVCELLRIHPPSIYKLIRKHQIPCFQIGSDWRFHRVP
jgi:excisionase family DNA binding protein